MSEISNSNLSGTYIAGTSPYTFNKTLLKIDSGIVNLVFDDLSFNNNLVIEGDGVLNIFVKGTITFTNNNTKLNIGGDPKQLNIFYVGDETLDLKNQQHKINGSVVIKSSKDIKFNDGELTGGYLVAPNAHVQLKTKSKVNAAIVAKSLKATGRFKSIITGDNSLPNPGGGSDSGSGNLSDLILSNPTYEK
jgi:hypothetical protein